MILFWINGNITLHSCKHWKTHCTLHYILYVLDQLQSDLLLHSVYCDSVSTLKDGKKIILWCCILPTHTYKPRSLGGKNTNHCESHQKGNHWPPFCMLDHTLYKSLVMFYTMPWNGKPFVPLWGGMEILELYILGSITTHTPHFTMFIYIYHLNTSLFRLTS
jgi:hypothetical protein